MTMFGSKKHRLSKMVYDEVSLVGIGAHQDALIVLQKNYVSKGDPSTGSVHTDACSCDGAMGSKGTCKTCGKKKSIIAKSSNPSSALKRFESISKCNPNHSKSRSQFTSESGKKS